MKWQFVMAIAITNYSRELLLKNYSRDLYKYIGVRSVI